MSQNRAGALCVAIHDVAPATWPECLKLLNAVRAVGRFPLSWLVVPRYHGSAARSHSYEAALEQLQADGHELVLHGLTHLDAAPESTGLRDLGRWFLRGVYTQREGEFAAIGLDEARCRLDAGLAWFAERGWPVSGFVPPAWLISQAAEQALIEYPFEYTTRYGSFQLLRPFCALRSPALVYTARNRAGRALSPPAVRLQAALMRNSPLVRLALHPRDARYPALVRHAQDLIAQLLATREPMTKAAFARRLSGSLTSTDPRCRPVPSDDGQSPHNNAGSHSAGPLPWR